MISCFLSVTGESPVRIALFVPFTIIPHAGGFVKRVNDFVLPFTLNRAPRSRLTDAGRDLNYFFFPYSDRSEFLSRHFSITTAINDEKP